MMDELAKAFRELLKHEQGILLILLALSFAVFIIFIVFHPIDKLTVGNTEHDLRWVDWIIALGALVFCFIFGRQIWRQRELALPSPMETAPAANALTVGVKSNTFEVSVPWKGPLSRMHGVHNNECKVLHAVNALEYSELAANYANFHSTKTIFTVCGIEPHKLIRQLEINRTNGECADEFSLASLRDLNRSGVQDLADRSFPHFRAFRTFHAERRGSIVRILLNTGNGWGIRNNAEIIELFEWLNGDIDCYQVNAQTLRRLHYVHFLTDFVVFNSDVFVYYYDDAETLTVTQSGDTLIRAQFMALENNFSRLGETALYKRIGGRH